MRQRDDARADAEKYAAALGKVSRKPLQSSTGPPSRRRSTRLSYLSDNEDDDSSDIEHSEAEVERHALDEPMRVEERIVRPLPRRTGRKSAYVESSSPSASPNKAPEAKKPRLSEEGTSATRVLVSLLDETFGPPRRATRASRGPRASAAAAAGLAQDASMMEMRSGRVLRSAASEAAVAFQGMDLR